jgi:hypothetical protein
VISYYRSASRSYVFGYAVAAGLSVILSLTATNSRLHTSLILAALLLLTAYVAVTVEKTKKLLAVLPWISLALLVSLIRPSDAEGTAASLLLLAASLLGCVSYWLFAQSREYFAADSGEVLDATAALVYMPILLGVFYSETGVTLPICLAVAGCLTLYHTRNNDQAHRELSVVIIVLALMWALAISGVRNLQAYTHIMAVVFGGFAYWRSLLNDRQTSDSYLYAMLATATIPLALQAMGGQSGGLYGWWLLLEQVGFLLLGIVINRRFITLWGLYVAIGAVLYQLRNLGWAALSFLALFIIGVAIYRLIKATDHQGDPPTIRPGA